MKIKVDAVVVTFNRLELLKKCLTAILNQTYEINNVYVIDNNSTDQTLSYLKNISKTNSKIQPVHLEKNVGGAGGFYEGMKLFVKEDDSDYVWIMDDDTVPSSTALEKIVAKINEVNNLGFLVSNVRWKDGKPAVMNIPAATTIWNNFVAKGLVEVEYASFVAILFPKKVITDIGLPIKEFFIWGDDVEYTKRITNSGYKGYLVSDSIVVHEIKQNIGTNIVLEKDKNRIARYYFARRNTMYTMKNRYNNKEFIKWVINCFLIEPYKIVRYSKNNRILRLKTSLKGSISGFFFNPPVYKFKKNNK